MAGDGCRPPWRSAGTAVLVVAATAGATTAVTAVPDAAGSPPVSVGTGRRATRGPPAVTTPVAAGTGGPIRVLLVGDSEASFLGFGLGPASTTHDVDYQGDGVFGCGLLTYTTSFHGTLVNGNVGQRGGHTLVPCDTQLVRWKADVEAFHPDVVLLADGEYEVRDQRIGTTWQHIGTAGRRHPGAPGPDRGDRRARAPPAPPSSC